MLTREHPLAAAYAIASDPTIRDCLFLVSKGIPFDVAFSLDDDARTAWAIVFGQLEGGAFDWHRGEWVKRSSD